ncbi:MAG: hypothetical protein U0703_18680 [Anaerolineae bacterium]
MSVGVAVDVLLGVSEAVGVGVEVGGAVAVRVGVIVRVGEAVSDGVRLGVSEGATVGVTCGTSRLQAASTSASSRITSRAFNARLLITPIINSGAANCETRAA